MDNEFNIAEDYIVFPNKEVTTVVKFKMVEIGHNVYVSHKFNKTFARTSRGFKFNLKSSKDKAVSIYINNSNRHSFEEKLEKTKTDKDLYI